MPLLDEPLSALIASKGLLARVNSLMPGKVTAAGKRLLTYVTTELLPGFTRL